METPEQGPGPYFPPPPRQPEYTPADLQQQYKAKSHQPDDGTLLGRNFYGVPQQPEGIQSRQSGNPSFGHHSHNQTRYVPDAGYSRPQQWIPGTHINENNPEVNRSADSSFVQQMHDQFRYTPHTGYSQQWNSNAAIPPPPYGPDLQYQSYNPADPVPSGRTNQTSYPAKPQFYRQSSRSQPSLNQNSQQPFSNYRSPTSPSSTGSSSSSETSEDDSRSRRRRRNRPHQQRARSVDTHVTEEYRKYSRPRTQQQRSSRKKRLAATLGGALAGGVAGRALDGGSLVVLAGVAAGAFGGPKLVKKMEEKKTAREKAVSYHSEDDWQNHERQQVEKDGQKAYKDRDYGRSYTRRRGGGRRESSSSESGSGHRQEEGKWRH